MEVGSVINDAQLINELCEILEKAIDVMCRARDREYNAFEPKNQSSLYKDCCTHIFNASILLVLAHKGKQ